MNMSTTSVENKKSSRINYIDGMRGFTMIMVVFSHVLMFCIGIVPSTSVVGDFFISFRMPVFFFISGFVAYKTQTWWTGKATMGRWFEKLLVQLVPTFIFFTLYMLMKGMSPLSFFGNGPGGYWFTIVLFEFLTLYFLIAFLSNILKFKYSELLLWVIGLLAFCYLALFGKENALWSTLSIRDFLAYLQFFAFGVVCRRYQEKVNALLLTDWLRTFVIASFFILFLSRWFGLIEKDSSLDRLSILFFLRYLGLIMVLMFFYRNRLYFDKDTFVVNALRFVGRRTLDIYLIHFFFLCDLSALKPFFENNAHSVIEFVFCVAFSLVIIAVTLLLSQLLRTSDFLAHRLFGVKPKKS